MPDIFFPQLHDANFLRETLHLPAAELAAQLGCHPLTVEKYRHVAGLVRRPRWSEVEVELVSHFYGKFPTAYIALGLRRSKQAVYTYAYRHGLRAGNTPRPSGRALARFWAVWQGVIQRNWCRWVQEGVAEQAFGLLWRPATAFRSCQDCPHLPGCQCQADKPLPCERLTVREVLSTIG
jgi:hypothetical protein